MKQWTNDKMEKMNERLKFKVALDLTTCYNYYSTKANCQVQHIIYIYIYIYIHTHTLNNSHSLTFVPISS